MKNYEKFEKFVISQKGVLIRDGKALIMELANHKNHWDLPGGRLDVGEIGEESFRREIEEELGFKEFENLGVIDYDIWLATNKQVPVCGICNLIKNDKDKIVISKEHSKMTWISEEEIDNFEYLWPKLGRMLKNGFKNINSLTE